MNAIINGCRPWLNQNIGDDCGSYFIDLSDKSDFSIGRSVFNLPVNSSCTYRAMSTCGYPTASYRVNDPIIAEDFDVAWASVEGLSPTNELDGWAYNETTDWNGSVQTNKTLEYVHLRYPSKGLISDDQWSKCNGVNRNLYITVTRTKNSKNPTEDAREARQLQFYPNGTKFADIEITFSNYKGAGSILRVAALAVAAGLAALAF